MSEPTTSKVALITGGGSGIGAATARTLARHGFSVAVTGRREEPLRATTEQILREGGHATWFRSDITNPSSVGQLFDEVETTFGRLDVLFNNAGYRPAYARLDEYSFEEWQNAISTNLTGALLCTQLAFRLMSRQRPRGGRIINNGSVSAQVPRPASVAYTATKHAMTGLTKSTALDGRGHGIACGQIDVGNAATDMTATPAERQAVGLTAEEPRIDPQHVADGVLYMAQLPLEANVLSMTVMATDMPFVGRG